MCKRWFEQVWNLWTHAKLPVSLNPPEPSPNTVLRKKDYRVISHEFGVVQPYRAHTLPSRCVCVVQLAWVVDVFESGHVRLFLFRRRKMKSQQSNPVHLATSTLQQLAVLTIFKMLFLPHNIYKAFITDRWSEILLAAWVWLREVGYAARYVWVRRAWEFTSTWHAVIGLFPLCLSLWPLTRSSHLNSRFSCCSNWNICARGFLMNNSAVGRASPETLGDERGVYLERLSIVNRQHLLA